jgi:Domain of unknown function (DUF4337)
MAEAHEVGDRIAETAHTPHGDDDAFRRGAALFIGALGMLLALASLGGESAMKEQINANILASDTYAFYQARHERQTSYELAAESLEALMATSRSLPADVRAWLNRRITEYRTTAQRYESDPAGGSGKQELLAKAHLLETRRELAQRRDINFDYSRALYQIAIVLGSVSIVAVSRPVLWLCGLLAIAATLLGANGFLQLVDLPWS